MPGLGLLVLRLALAISLSVDAVTSIKTGLAADEGVGGALLWACGVALSGGCVLTGLGFLTAVAQIVFLAAGAGTVAAWLLATESWRLLSGPWHLVLLEIAAATAFLLTGPGAHSVDARLFGRHEINIPSRAAASGPTADID